MIKTAVSDFPMRRFFFAMDAMVLTTQRLVLKPFTLDDADILQAAFNDPDILNMTGSKPMPYGIDDARHALGKRFPEREANGGFEFAIWRDSDALIGGVGLRICDNETGTDRKAELGYWIARAFWGQGYASEAVEAACAYGFSHAKVEDIEASHFLDNPASGRILEKFRFAHVDFIPLKSRARGCEAPGRLMRLSAQRFRSVVTPRMPIGARGENEIS
ncbi:MAG: GNAT family N-acetyltransferase [Pseudomonadota bacterium]